MRQGFVAFVLAGMTLVGISVSGPVHAISAAAPEGLRAAIEDVGITERAHCRSYRHRHSRYDPRYHPWGTGCVVAPFVGPVIVRPAPRRRVIIVR